MKLISLYIENFGGLSRYALNFEENLTVIEEANGFGKSTLAEFIRAMLYGFPRKAKTLDKSRRQKYTPWNGGKFGGNLVFEADGCRYRVERSFGATPKGDTFTLIDLATNKKSTRYSEELGLELFRLDADSFERSTYLPQMGDNSVLTTDSIRSKLSNLVEDTNDVGNFEKAMAALRAKRSTLVPYRGNGGSVMQAGGRISQLQEQLHRTQSRQTELDNVDVRIGTLECRQTELENDRSQIRLEIRQASEAAAVAAIHRQHGRMMAQRQAAEAEYVQLRQRYPAGIPTMEQIEQARDGAARLEILKSRTVTEQEDLDAEGFLQENRHRFENRIPTAQMLAACRDWCRIHSEQRREMMELAAAAAKQPEVRVNPLPLILLVLLGVAGTVPGVILLLGQELLWGGIALGVGVIALIGSLFAAVRLASVRKQLQAFRQNQLEIHAEMDRLSAQTEQLKSQIESFLESYGLTGETDFYGRLAELEHSAEDYLRAQARVSQWQKDLAAHETEWNHWNEMVEMFFAEASLTARPDVQTQLLQIRDDRKDWEELEQKLIRMDQELEQFRQENNHELSQPAVETEDPETLKRKEAELTVRLSTCAEELLRQRQHRELLRSQVEQIPELCDQLQYWLDKKRADQKKTDLLDDAMALLEQAKENLSGSYLGPIHRSFTGYLEKLWGGQEGQVLVTPDLEVQLERSGMARELAYFSAGQTDAVMLCMRLALVDALFDGEKPFVILDDPFINLDDERTKQALQLLQNLAEDRQILYLTCNSSRIPQ